jgi:hypothetical protein
MLRIKEQETRLILHDDGDDDDNNNKILCPKFFSLLVLGITFTRSQY